MRLVALLVVLLGGTLYVNTTPDPIPLNCGTLVRTHPDHLPQGHAHNDYEHHRPLVDALHAGLTSVEADVWAVDGHLLVAHTQDEVDRARTLSSLYLRPLAQRFAGNRHGPRVQLLIDVKSDPSTTLPLLRAQLAHYASVLTRYRGCTATPGPVSVVLSGNARPAAPSGEGVSYFGYDVQPERTHDTRLRDAVTPLVSARWDAYFSWDGHGSMPRGERGRLREMVRAAHLVGSAIRFYDTPDDRGAARDAVWRELAAAGVDYINTDDLAGFRAFIHRLGDSRRTGGSRVHPGPSCASTVGPRRSVSIPCPRQVRWSQPTRR